MNRIIFAILLIAALIAAWVRATQARPELSEKDKLTFGRGEPRWTAREPAGSSPCSPAWRDSGWILKVDKC